MEERIRFEEGEPESLAEGVEVGEPPSRITGSDIAYVFANIFAPSPATDGKPLTPEEAREYFIQDYTAAVGPILDLVGFADAAEALNPSLIPPWLRISIGVGAMVLGGVFFRSKYKPSERTATSRKLQVKSRKPKPVDRRLQSPGDRKPQGTSAPKETGSSLEQQAESERDLSAPS